jgi:hypothetical protein
LLQIPFGITSCSWNAGATCGSGDPPFCGGTTTTTTASVTTTVTLAP